MLHITFACALSTQNSEVCASIIYVALFCLLPNPPPAKSILWLSLCLAHGSFINTWLAGLGLCLWVWMWGGATQRR